jgi:hypothetical protein
MLPARLLSRFLGPGAVAGCWLACIGSVWAAESAPPVSGPPAKSTWDLAEFIDGLPDLLSERLPGFDQTGALRLYVRPHFGDVIHRDYLRVPFGARAKITSSIESSAELQTYFTHGISDPAGYGLSGIRLGAKAERLLPSINDGAGVSLGFNYQTPLSRPPVDLTDGHRHFQPYVAATRPIMPAWKLLGFAGIGADLLSRTHIPAHFGRNQLHSNSLSFVGGAAREFKRLRASLTATVTTGALVSDEFENVYAIRPEVVIPWRLRPNARTLVHLTVGGRSIWGPDGHEIGLSSSVRFEFLLRRAPSAK